MKISGPVTVFLHVPLVQPLEKLQTFYTLDFQSFTTHKKKPLPYNCNSIRFDSIWFDSIQFNSIQFNIYCRINFCLYFMFSGDFLKNFRRERETVFRNQISGDFQSFVQGRITNSSQKYEDIYFLSSDALYNYIFLCHVCLSVCLYIRTIHVCPAFGLLLITYVPCKNIIWNLYHKVRDH
jgi:hypothetical protein